MTPEMQRAFEDVVRRSLKDPDSAKFKHYFAYKTEKGTIQECGAVNSKNSYGGYSGFEDYSAIVTEDDQSGYRGIISMISNQYGFPLGNMYPECD